MVVVVAASGLVVADWIELAELASCFALCVIVLVVASRLATCVARIVDIVLIRPFSVKLRKTSTRSNRLVCFVCVLAIAVAFTIRSRACRTRSFVWLPKAIVVVLCGSVICGPGKERFLVNKALVRPVL